MTNDSDRTPKERTPPPPQDRWARDSFTLRRMTWTNIWMLVAGLVLAMILLAVFVG